MKNNNILTTTHKKQTLSEIIIHKLADNYALHKAADATEKGVTGCEQETAELLEEYYSNGAKKNKLLDAYAATMLVLKDRGIPLSNKEYSEIFGRHARELNRHCRKIKRNTENYSITPAPLKHWVKRREKELLLINPDRELRQKINTLTKKAEQEEEFIPRTNKTISAAIIYAAVKDREDGYNLTQDQIAHATSVSKSTIRKNTKLLE